MLGSWESIGLGDGAFNGLCFRIATGGVMGRPQAGTHLVALFRGHGTSEAVTVVILCVTRQRPSNWRRQLTRRAGESG